MVVNDVSVRDWQFRSPTMTLGKSFDTHGPMGPWLVTADEIVDPHDLRIRTWVDDDLLQDGHTSQMVYDVWQQIEVLTTVMTLEPGTVIATGTPAGVGMARSRSGGSSRARPCASRSTASACSRTRSSRSPAAL